MVYPAAVALALGIGIGAAIFLIYYGNNGFQQQNRQRQHPHRDYAPRDPLAMMHERFDDLCSICLEAFSEAIPQVQLHCTHQFHKRCIERSLEFSRTCPNCRQPAIMRID